MDKSFTLFGPGNKYNQPEGGFCISVFAILTQPRKVLLIKPKKHERWMNEWAPNWNLYDSEHLETEFKKWRFPSSYILEGESPIDTLGRVMKEQLGIKSYRVVSQELLNFYDESRRYPGKMHWDYCFVFHVSAKSRLIKKPWFWSAQYVKRKELHSHDFGSSQGYLARRLNLIEDASMR